MTPERWRQIDELFDAALRLEPAARAAWLRRLAAMTTRCGPRSAPRWTRMRGRTGTGS